MFSVGAFTVVGPPMKDRSLIVVMFVATAKPLLVPALTVGVPSAVVVTLWFELASSETGPVDVSAPDVVTYALVLTITVVAAMAAAAVWGPAAGAVPRA